MEPPDCHVDDEGTFRALYPQLRRFTAVVSASGDDPDDLVQEALMRVLARGGLADLDSPAAYLKRTILNLAADRRRSLGRGRRALSRLRVRDGTESDFPSDLADLDRLSPVDRAVLFLAEVEGLPQAEVAETLGLSHQAVRSRASRARRQLRQDIEAEETGNE